MGLHLSEVQTDPGSLFNLASITRWRCWGNAAREGARRKGWESGGFFLPASLAVLGVQPSLCCHSGYDEWLKAWGQLSCGGTQWVSLLETVTLRSWCIVVCPFSPLLLSELQWWLERHRVGFVLLCFWPQSWFFLLFCYRLTSETHQWRCNVTRICEVLFIGCNLKNVFYLISTRAVGFSSLILRNQTATNHAMKSTHLALELWRGSEVRLRVFLATFSISWGIRSPHSTGQEERQAGWQSVTSWCLFFGGYQWEEQCRNGSDSRMLRSSFQPFPHCS